MRHKHAHKLFMMVALQSAFGCSSGRTKHPDEVIEVTDYECTPAKEFITTINFLRDKNTFAIKDEAAQEIALSVASGCRGAAQRFISVSSVLIQVGFPSKEALELGIMAGKGEDDQAEAFLTVFRASYLAKGLDLKPDDAVNLARSLSLDLKGDRRRAREDFERLVEYCIDPRNISLPRPKCGAIAARVAAKGENSDHGVAEPFIDAIEFITRDSKGPQLPLFQAFAIAEELAMTSPKALSNFSQAYRWAASKDGLTLDRQKAVALSKQIALKAAQKRLVRFENHQRATTPR